MSYEVFVALRYLSASRRRAHVALISTISILGLAVGVAALVISLALLSGFQDRIRAQMALRSPHVVVSPERGDRLDDPESVRPALSSPCPGSSRSTRWSKGEAGSPPRRAARRCRFATATSPRARCGYRRRRPARARLGGRGLAARSGDGGPPACSRRGRGSRPSARSRLRPGRGRRDPTRQRAGEGRGAGGSRADRANAPRPPFRGAGLRGPARRSRAAATPRGHRRASAGRLPGADVARIERAPLLRSAPREVRHLRHGRARDRRRGVEHRLEHRAPRGREEEGPRRPRPRSERTPASLGEDLPRPGRPHRRSGNGRGRGRGSRGFRCSSTAFTPSRFRPTCTSSRTSPLPSIRAKSRSSPSSPWRRRSRRRSSRREPRRGWRPARPSDSQDENSKSTFQIPGNPFSSCNLESGIWNLESNSPCSP